MRICVTALHILRELAHNGYSNQVLEEPVLQSILDVIEEQIIEDSFLHKAAFEVLNTLVQ